MEPASEYITGMQMKITITCCLFVALVVTTPCAARQRCHNRMRFVASGISMDRDAQVNRMCARRLRTKAYRINRVNSVVTCRPGRIAEVDRALKVIYEQVAVVESARNYECVLHARHNDGSSEMRTVTMSLRIRRDPLSAFARYWAPPAMRFTEQVYFRGGGDAAVLQFDARYVLLQAVNDLMSTEGTIGQCGITHKEGARVNHERCRMTEIWWTRDGSAKRQLIQLLAYEESGFPARIARIEEGQMHSDRVTNWDFTYWQVQTNLTMTDESFTPWVNPQKQPVEEETAGLAVLGEAVPNPATWQSP